MDKKKYIISIVALSLAIVAEPFVSFKMGNKILINRKEFETIKQVADKYARQEDIIKEVKKDFLFEVDDEKIMEGSIKGAIDGFGDPYTEYLDKEEYDSYLDALSGEYVGVGFVIIEERGGIVIDKVLANSPAEKIGLKAGDKIKSVDGEEVGFNDQDIADKVRGEKGTSVNLVIIREGKELSFDIVRDKVEIQVVSSKKIGDIGYIKYAGFDVLSGEKFKSALDGLINEGAKKLIIDLRDNPGGDLEEVKYIGGLFIPYDTVIAFIKDKNGREEEIKSENKLDPIDMPIVILVNENSASASEMFSGMMQHYKKATIVGTKTFGKGIAQNMLNLTDGSGAGYKVTFEEYFTPGKNKVHKIGITPDIDLSDEEDYYETTVSDDLDGLTEDFGFKKAVEVLNK